ncbi:MAG: cytochrome c [Bdellovibrionota bacterium]
MKSFKSLTLILATSVLLVAVGCTKKTVETSFGDKSLSDTSAVNGDAPVANPAIERGKKVYMANCIACHNINPKQDGGIGPANWGSSKELLHAKVLTNTYPAGYAPKRPSKAMAPLPHLEKDIDDLAAFLNAQ